MVSATLEIKNYLWSTPIFINGEIADWRYLSLNIPISQKESMSKTIDDEKTISANNAAAQGPLETRGL